jgi:hypothetical protein
MIDPVAAFLKRANVTLPAPVSSSLVLSTEHNSTSAKILQYHNISDPVTTASKVLTTLNNCEDLLIASAESTGSSGVKLLRIQSEKTQSLIITGISFLSPKSR